MDQKIIDHFEAARPILDKENMFLFFPNNKVAQTSINRHLLKGRTITYKDDNEEYAKQFQIRKVLFELVYKFTIVRNPWDRVVSGFSYLRTTKRSLPVNIKSMSFEDFVVKVFSKYGHDFDAHFNPQYPNAFCDGECFVDFIGKLESIQQDWKTIAQKIGAPEILPHKNRSNHKSYHSYYTTKSADIVQNIYQQDVDAFGYIFHG